MVPSLIKCSTTSPQLRYGLPHPQSVMSSLKILIKLVELFEGIPDILPQWSMQSINTRGVSTSKKYQYRQRNSDDATGVEAGEKELGCCN